jgi:hypothetical protein
MFTFEDLEAYVVTDGFFGGPYIDKDEERNEPVSHRYVHGGFAGTDTRFAFYFPPKERYHGRLYQPLEGANAGHEGVYGGPLGVVRGTMDMIFRLGGYMVESNMGHIGATLDPKAGNDASIYGFRAAGESARFSKFLAERLLGQAPHHSYVFGGSGGAARSPQCLEYCPDVWDAALPYVGGASIVPRGDFDAGRTAGTNKFSPMFNVQRLLGDKLLDVIDAVSPGGSGDPYTGLDTHQREELATMYRIGYPRGDEWVVSQPSGIIWQWASLADSFTSTDSYYEAFWTEPGHVGHDQPELVASDVIDAQVTVTRTLSHNEMAADPRFADTKFEAIRFLAQLFADLGAMWDVPMAVEVEGLPVAGYRLGANVRVLTGSAAGRSLWCIKGVENVLLCDGAEEASNARFTGVLPGDEVRVDNHAFLAQCYFYRHHLPAPPSPAWDSLRVDGVPIYPQYDLPFASPLGGVGRTGQYEGKLMWVQHTHDASLWPSDVIGYRDGVIAVQGSEAAVRKYRLRWTENAEHATAENVPSMPGRNSTTWLIDYFPIIEQCLADLTRWVEDGIEPDPTTYEMADGKIILPSTAAERGGIQPVVHVTANGGARADVRVGEPVTLEVHAEAPRQGGTIIAAQWDFEGSGAYPFRHDAIDGTASQVTLTTTHSWDRPGTYFATALVHSHVDGDVDATSRRLPNLASARVVVT